MRARALHMLLSPYITDKFHEGSEKRNENGDQRKGGNGHQPNEKLAHTSHARHWIAQNAALQAQQDWRQNNRKRRQQVQNNHCAHSQQCRLKRGRSKDAQRIHHGSVEHTRVQQPSTKGHIGRDGQGQGKEEQCTDKGDIVGPTNVLG